MLTMALAWRCPDVGALCTAVMWLLSAPIELKLRPQGQALHGRV